MNKYLFPIYAVILGYIIVAFAKQKAFKNISLLLAFSGAFLLSLTVFDLLPEVYEVLDAKSSVSEKESAADSYLGYAFGNRLASG